MVFIMLWKSLSLLSYTEVITIGKCSCMNMWLRWRLFLFFYRAWAQARRSRYQQTARLVKTPHLEHAIVYRGVWYICILHTIIGAERERCSLNGKCVSYMINIFRPFAFHQVLNFQTWRVRCNYLLNFMGFCLTYVTFFFLQILSQKLRKAPSRKGQVRTCPYVVLFFH